VSKHPARVEGAMLRFAVHQLARAIRAEQARAKQMAMENKPILIDVRTVLPKDYGQVWKRSLWEAYGQACGICNDPVTLEEFQVDHIVQRCQGGGNEWTNLRPAHKPCNNGRPRGPVATRVRTSGKWQS
jgi:hypothetical protein